MRAGSAEASYTPCPRRPHSPWQGCGAGSSRCGERRAGSFVRDRGMTASPRSAADRACARASVVACRSVVAMPLCSYVRSKKGRGIGRDAPGPERLAGNPAERFTPWRAWGGSLPNLGCTWLEVAIGVYRLVVALEGESRLPGWFAGVPVGNSDLA